MEKIWWLSLIVSLLSLLLNYQICQGRKLHDPLGSPTASYVTHLQLRNTKIVHNTRESMVHSEVEEVEMLLEEERKEQSEIEETLETFKTMKKDLRANAYQLFDDGKKLADAVRNYELFENRCGRIAYRLNYLRRDIDSLRPDYIDFSIDIVSRRLKSILISYMRKRGSIFTRTQNALKNFWPYIAVSRVREKIDADLVSMDKKIDAIEAMWDPKSIQSDPEAVKSRMQSTDDCVTELTNVGKIVDRMEFSLQQEIVLERSELKWSQDRKRIVNAFFKSVASYRKQLFNFQTWAKQHKEHPLRLTKDRHHHHHQDHPPEMKKRQAPPSSSTCNSRIIHLR